MPRQPAKLSADVDMDDILREARSTPGCFPDRIAWAEYLRSSQICKKLRPKPFIDGEYNPAFNFCKDCSPMFQQQMTNVGRCEQAKPMHGLTNQGRTFQLVRQEFT